MSDILTIHTRLSDRTLGYVDNNKLKLMKKGSVIVNTSRGPIIKEKDLIAVSYTHLTLPTTVIV